MRAPISELPSNISTMIALESTLIGLMMIMKAKLDLRKRPKKRRRVAKISQMVTSKESSTPIFFFRKRPISPHKCATCSELPSQISTMNTMINTYNIERQIKQAFSGSCKRLRQTKFFQQEHTAPYKGFLRMITLYILRLARVLRPKTFSRNVDTKFHGVILAKW